MVCAWVRWCGSSRQLKALLYAQPRTPWASLASHLMCRHRTPLTHPDVNVVVCPPEHSQAGEAGDEVRAAQLRLSHAVHLCAVLRQAGSARDQPRCWGPSLLPLCRCRAKAHPAQQPTNQPPGRAQPTFAKRMRPSEPSGYFSCTCLVAASQAGSSRWHQWHQGA
jgi:hypothetical protein